MNNPATIDDVQKLLSEAGYVCGRPLATVVIGGIVSATALTLLVLPALYRVVRGERTEVPETGTSDENPNPQLAS